MDSDTWVSGMGGDDVLGPRVCGGERMEGEWS